MERHIAEEIAKIAAECSRQTDESVKEVMVSCDAEVFQQYRRLAGRVMGYIFTDLLAPLWSEHQEIAPAWFRERDSGAGAARKPTIDADMRDRLLALVGEMTRSMAATVDLIDSSSEHGQGARMREAVAEILEQVNALADYVRTLEVSSKAGSNE